MYITDNIRYLDNGISWCHWHWATSTI